MEKLSNPFIMTVLIPLILSIYYAIPIKNKNNISTPELKNRFTETGGNKGWSTYYQLLAEGNPKDEKFAFAIIERAAYEGYVYDIFHLGYLTEKGLGIEADPIYAQEIYTHAFNQYDTLDENSLDFITKDLSYLFYGENGTEILRTSFAIALNTKK